MSLRAPPAALAGAAGWVVQEGQKREATLQERIMDIESIAHWSILRPSDCDTPVDRWPELTRRTLEVSSGEARTLSADDLARWLAALRGS